MRTRLALLLLALAALALAPTAASAQEAGCDTDRAVVDAGADGQVSVGDPFVSLPGALGPSSEAGRLGKPVLALGGTLAFFDVDGDGALSKGEAWALDRGAAGPTVGDLLLTGVENDAGARIPFGTVLRAGSPTPGGSLLPVPGGVLAFLDDSGDGVRQPGEGLYAARGATLQPNDVRLWVDGFEPGSLVATTDPDRGAAAVPGPAFAFLDADGSGTFVVADCPESTTSSSASSSASTSEPGRPTIPDESPTVSPSIHGDPCEAFGGCRTETETGGSKGSPLPPILPAVALLVALAVARRRFHR